ncbi:MAG: PP2C family protein-serine/threonine phosphatase, partial [Planctomycetota bacterium]
REYTDPGTGRRTFTTVLLDVTGHGIAAALTVNRLVGELERSFAMNPAVTCDEIMAAVNSYAYYTLANHAIFVTGVASSICDCGDGTWELCFASAGHPTAFLRRASGQCETLESTTMMLGVLPPEVFDPASTICQFEAGDVLVIYTDGASEASRPEGGMMGIEGVQRLVQNVGDDSEDPTNWPDRMIRHVARWRNAPPDDDTLIAVLYRPLHAELEDVAEPAQQRVAAQYAEAM